MKKIITFVNDTPHADVEELSLTYQSSIFFSDNGTTTANEYDDIYHNSYLYSYIQGVNKTKNTVKFSSGIFKIDYIDDKLCSSYIYMSDEETTLYPTNNVNFISYQNEYNFNIYHSNDIDIDISNISYDDRVFKLIDNQDYYTLKLKNNVIPSSSSYTFLNYNLNSDDVISTKINIKRETPNFSFESKRITVNNNSYFNIPFSLDNNYNHANIEYEFNSRYITQINNLKFRAISETLTDTYTVIKANISEFNKTAYAYVIIAPTVKAESMSIKKYSEVSNGQEIIDSGLNYNYTNYVPYQTSYDGAGVGTGNTFQARIFPPNATNKNVVWHSTDPSTMKIVATNYSNNTVNVKYYKPGKVILYATHEYNNDNELRAFMLVTITGGVIITKIFPIEVYTPQFPNHDRTYHVIDGDHIQFIAGHQPVDSELSLLFEGNGESYIDSARQRYKLDKYNDVAYSYFNTYANVKNWGNDTEKTYTLSVAYSGTGTTDNYAFAPAIKFYKLYSTPYQTSIKRNNNYEYNNTIYYGDDAILTYVYKVYPRKDNDNSKIGINGSNINNHTTYSSVINGENMPSNKIKLNYDSSNEAIKIETTLDSTKLNTYPEGEYAINNTFSYQYNALKKLEGTSSQIVNIKSPRINTSVVDVTYHYTGNIGSYLIEPSDATFQITDNEGLPLSLVGGEIKVTNTPESRKTHNIKYRVNNRNYTSGQNSFSVNVKPVEIKLKDANNNFITNIQTPLDDNDSTIDIAITYILLPDNNVVDFDKECIVDVDSGSSSYVTAEIISNNTLRIHKNNNIMNFDSNNFHTTTITIKNRVSTCTTQLEVKFTLNAVYITLLSITFNNPNEQIYYNSEGNPNYKRQKTINVSGTFHPNNSSLTTAVTASSNTSALTITPSAVNIGPNSSEGIFTFSANEKVSSTVNFGYYSGKNQPQSISLNLNSYVLPYEMTLEPNSNAIYETDNVTFTMNVTKYNEMNPQMKNASYWFIGMDQNKFIKNSNFSYTLKNLNGISQYPIIQYDFTYGINSQYAYSGEMIPFNNTLYLLYTYMYGRIDDIYYKLNNPTYLYVNTYCKNDNNVNINYDSSVFSQNPLTNNYSEQINMTYNNTTLFKKYVANKYTLNDNHLSSNLSVSSHNIQLKYNGITYYNITGNIFYPSINLSSPSNNITTYTNGQDGTNWPKSFSISYSTSNWPSNYIGTWSYWHNGIQISGNNGTYAPGINSNGGKIFYVKCDNLKSSEKNIYTHTLCDNFQLDPDKSYLPIVVAPGYPYTIVNKYQGVQANNSNATIDIAPESYVASATTSKFTCNDKTITYQSVSDDSPRNVTITYSCGHFNNSTALTTQYPVYTINYGFRNLTLMRKTSGQLNTYINGITGASLQLSTNTDGASISGNTLSFVNVPTSRINQNIPISVTCTYAAENNKNYVFDSTQNVKVLPYRNPYIIQLQFSVNVSNITPPDETSTLYSGGEIFTTEGVNNTSDTHYDDYPIFKMTLENNLEIYLVVNGHKSTKFDYLRTCNFQFALKKMSGGLFVNIDNNENIFTSSVSQLNITATTPPQQGYVGSPITLLLKTDLEYNNLIFDNNIVIDNIEGQRVGIHL